ncbi:MAG: DUF2232 domain-containing protein, partial [Spirochaetia bacterium]
FGVPFFLFLIPIQSLYARRGMGAFLSSSLTVFSGIAIVRSIQAVASPAIAFSWPVIIFNLVIPFIFIAGLYIVNTQYLKQYRTLHRLLISAAAFAVASIPVLVIITSNEQIIGAIEGFIRAIVEAFQSAAAQTDTYESVEMQALLNPEEMFSLWKEMFFRTYVFEYFLIVTGTWWLGSLFAFRRKLYKRGPKRLLQFSLPEFFIWPLLLSWTGILLDTIFGLGFGGYVFWNAGLITVFLYLLQGIGILQFLIVKFKVPRIARFMFIFALITLMLVPYLYFIMLLLIPGIGISETWINFGRFERSDHGNQDNSE